MALLRIAQAQINSVVGDLIGNAQKIVDAIAEAQRCNADIVLFPELALCGYPPEDLLLKTHFLRDTRKALEEIVVEVRDIVVALGFADIDRETGKSKNAAALIHGGRILDVYHKIELPNYGVFDERRYFIPGDRCCMFRLFGVPTYITICEDVWIEGGVPERFAVQNEARLILNLSASPFHAGKTQIRHEILSRLACAANAHVCYTNLVGGQDELVFDGGSMIVAPDGEIVSSGVRFDEDMIVTDLDVPSGPVREVVHPNGGESPIIEIQSEKKPRDAKAPARQERKLDTIEEIYAALVLGTRDYVRKNGFRKVVLGLSGGIDSSLTAAIAVDALGAENVTGVTMPSQYTSEGTRSDAARLAKNLGIKLYVEKIHDIFQSYTRELADALGDGPPGIEMENLQARIRANILMTLSNRYGWLVLTTGNKSETAVGYCTLYGDMAGGLAVIKDVFKTTVYDLAAYVNEKAGREIIPKSIFERPPTAELRPGQKDEDTLPPYPILDPILHRYIERDMNLDEIAAEGFDRDTVCDVIQMVDRNEYKRRQAAPGIKITPKAFGRDRRIPITNRYVPLKK